MSKPQKKNTGIIQSMVEQLSKNEAAIVSGPDMPTEGPSHVVKVQTRRGYVLVDQSTGAVVKAQGIWREGKPDVGIVDGEELISLDKILMELRLNNPMAANLVHKYFLDRKSENKDE